MPKFDPFTGKPVPMFDPETGKPLNNANPDFGVTLARPGDMHADPSGEIDPTTGKVRTLPVETANLYDMLKAELARDVESGDQAVARTANRLLILCAVLDHTGVAAPLAEPSKADEAAAFAAEKQNPVQL